MSVISTNVDFDALLFFVPKIKNKNQKPKMSLVKHKVSICFNIAFMFVLFEVELFLMQFYKQNIF